MPTFRKLPKIQQDILQLVSEQISPDLRAGFFSECKFCLSQIFFFLIPNVASNRLLKPTVLAKHPPDHISPLPNIVPAGTCTSHAARILQNFLPALYNDSLNRRGIHITPVCVVSRAVGPKRE